MTWTANLGGHHAERGTDAEVETGRIVEVLRETVDKLTTAGEKVTTATVTTNFASVDLLSSDFLSEEPS
jgi:hypothetical protein